MGLRVMKLRELGPPPIIFFSFPFSSLRTFASRVGTTCSQHGKSLKSTQFFSNFSNSQHYFHYIRDSQCPSSKIQNPCNDRPKTNTQNPKPKTPPDAVIYYCGRVPLTGRSFCPSCLCRPTVPLSSNLPDLNLDGLGSTGLLVLVEQGWEQNAGGGEENAGYS